MWYTFRWWSYIVTYVTLAITSSCVLLFFGMPCDDSFESAPIFCKIIFAILYGCYGLGSLLADVSTFFSDHGMLCLVIGWLAHSYIIMLIINLIKYKFSNKNFHSH